MSRTCTGDGGSEHGWREPLGTAEIDSLQRWWRAANYLSVGQIYLMGNPLLRESLRPEHVKPRLLGHWGTTPGLNFVYGHLNRAINQRDLSVLFLVGPGHGGPAAVACAYLDGTYSEIYPAVGQDEEGLRRLFRRFSFPGGIPSHVAPETPGSIHEGGELGYSLTHAFGAVFDNPDLLVAAVVGDGEAETGPLAAGWQSTRFLNARRDGAVLPILHLNGYKIASPTVMARIPQNQLLSILRGNGWTPYVVDGSDPEGMHQAFAATLDRCLDEVAQIQARARRGSTSGQVPSWPMIVLRSPKGWSGPAEVDGQKVEGTWRAHQVPVGQARQDDGHRRILEDWMRSYGPEDLFDDAGRLFSDVVALAPTPGHRMSDNPHANGGVLLRDLDLPDFQAYAVPVQRPGTGATSPTETLAAYLRDTVAANPSTFRMFAPDEHNSNRLEHVLEETDRAWSAHIQDDDVGLAPDGRVMEILSEHTCQGWLEGYLLTGRHGLFSCYEAFIHIVDSMVNQHAKWLKTCADIEWRQPIASLNYLLTSHVWRQDHNGFSHQDPGFIDHIVNKKAGIVRVYLPPDADTLLCVADHCLRSRNYINVIVAGKHPALQYLTMEQAVLHTTKGIGIWDWASNDGQGLDVVMACAGDVPTMETLAAVELLRDSLPDLRIRVVNVVDLMRLQDDRSHPHGSTPADFDALFTTDKPVIFAYHGYPWLIHRLTYRHTNHANFHVRGYIEEGTTTTPFDMTVVNKLDRYNLAIDVLDRVPRLGDDAHQLRQQFKDALVEHTTYVRRHGDDLPKVREWQWHPK